MIIHNCVIMYFKSSAEIIGDLCHLLFQIHSSEQEWDMQIILNEARKNPAANGPYWILGSPPGVMAELPNSGH